MRLLALLFTAAWAVFGADAPRAAARPPAAKIVRVPFAGSETPLSSSDLKATTDAGKPARVVRLRTGKDDLLVLIVMDVVGDISLADSARSALLDRYKELPATTWFSLLRSQDGLQVVLDPTSDREKFGGALLAMPVTGKAGLLDTIETAAGLADSIAAKSAVRVAVLYITDSDVRNYREDFTNPVINSSDSRDLSRRFPEGLIREKVARLTETIAAYQTPVFMVHLHYASDRLNEAYQSGLMQLASATGGQATFCRSQADIAAAVTRAVDSIQAMGVAWVQLPPKTSRTVAVMLDAQGQALALRSRFVLK